MTRRRLFLWTAAMVVAAFVVPQGAQVLGMHLAGMIWQSLQLTIPFLSELGDVLGGVIGGALVGLLQWACFRQARARWIQAAALAGAAIGAAHALYPPLALLAAPVAGALAALFEAPQSPRWARAQALAAAWVAVAVMVPFPRWVTAGFLVGAAVLSAWGIAWTPHPQLQPPPAAGARNGPSRAALR
ncbi:MAG TPA: hypothetical protein VFP52_14655 [Myxococcales bacterium]|nr:hypothetical protein [Myxococcales bacterium]